MKKTVSLFVILSLFLSGCKIQPVVLTAIEDIKFGNIDFLRGTLMLDMGMRIKNPNKFTAAVHSMELELSINGAKLGSLFVEDKVKIRKDTEEVYRMHVNAYLSDIIIGIPKIVQAIAAKQATVSVKGSVRAGVGPFRKKFPVDYTQENVTVTP
ncbi:MAG TPA: LEA type 2 family protein [Bacteroidia bacterium]|nr:LEA type 2 family protein [Bacteroidia bacterium]